MVRASMVTLLLVGGGLAAQTAPQPAPAPAPAAPAAPSGPRLGLLDALRTALQNNLQVGIAQSTREATQAGITTSLGAFDWNASVAAQYARLDNATPVNASSRNGAFYTQTQTAYQRSLTAAVSKALDWGGSLKLEYAPVYDYMRGTVHDFPTAGTDAPFSSYTPYSGAFTVTYNQNLLQGFGTTVTQAPVVIARKNGESADYTYRLAIVSLLNSVENDYWSVVGAQRGLENAQISLKLARQQLDENMVRLKVGTMAPLDVTQAQAQVATAEKTLIGAQATLDNAQDALLNDLYPGGDRPASVTVTDAPNLAHIQLDEAAAAKMALERRLELRNLQVQKDIQDINLAVAQDKVRPQLNASVAYNGASSSYNALGPVNGDLAGAKYPGYTLGLTFAVPIENRAAKGGLAQTRANLRGAELNLRQEELTVTLQARSAVRNIVAAEKAVKAAGESRYFQEKTLEAEQKKFANGMSTNFIVLQDMTNLDNARNTETQAQIAYANAVTALEVAVGNLIEARNFSVR